MAEYDEYPDPNEPTDAEIESEGEEEDDLGVEEPVLDEVSESVRKRLEAFVPELVKKTFAAGMGAVFTTEEGIRRLTKEMRLPKDVAGYLVSTASSTKDEFLRILAREVREFLQTVNLSEEIAKVLTMLSFEVKTEVRFIPNEERYGGVEPDVNAKVRLKRSDRGDRSAKSGRGGKSEQEGEPEPESGQRRRRLTRRRWRTQSDDEEETG